MKKKKLDLGPSGERIQRPFAALAARLGAGASGTAGTPGVPPAAGATTLVPGAPARAAAPPARAVVRLERKGRGGKTVTVVEKLELDDAERARWLAEMKRAVGCGGTLEGEALTLQGDVRARVKKFLEDRGVSRVTLG